jgi:hypothetical protein
MNFYYEALVVRGRALKQIPFRDLVVGDVFQLCDQRDGTILLTDIYQDGQMVGREERWLKATTDAATYQSPSGISTFSIHADTMPADFNPDMELEVPLPAWVGQFLNRRAAVEQEMFNASRAGAPVAAAQVRAWALRLGQPATHTAMAVAS